MDFKGIRVLLLDGFGRQIPSMLRQLYELRCEITTLNSSKLDPGYASRYPNKKIVIKGLKDNDEVLAKAVDEQLLSGNYDVVIPVTDKSTNYVTKNKSKFPNVKIAAAPYEAFIRAYDKEETLKTCQEIGVPCPLTRMDNESIEEYLSKAKFPLAVKPRKGTGSIGFKKIDTPEQLYQLIEDKIVVPNEYVIQEFIPQDDIQYVCYMFIDGQGKLKSSMTAAKRRWFPIDGGSMCLGQAVDRPDLIEYSLHLLRGINWSGFCQVGYINDPRDNTPKILEINGRIPASVKLCHLCGSNIMQQLIEFAYGEEVTFFKTDIRNGISLRYFQTDFLWFLKSKQRFKAKPSWFNFRNSKDYIFSIKDPWPFFAYSLRGMFSYDKEMKRRKR